MVSHRSLQSRSSAAAPSSAVSWCSIIVLLMRLSLYWWCCCCWAIGVVNGAAGPNSPPPHIVIILADDLGFNDVSFHGSDQIPTPNIDALAYQGQILNRHYVAAMCTPSRAALLTGKYPIRTGMQHYVISSDAPWGLPVEEKVLPEYLQELGYHTNLVGKWHLGLAQKNFTPPHRGFDHFRGYLGPYIDFYNHSLLMGNKPYAEGYDMRLNEDVDYANRGKYVTDMLTEYAVDVIQGHNATKPLFLMLSHLAPHTGNENAPMLAPQDYVDRFAYISDPMRQIYAAMVAKLDDSVGAVVEALRAREMLENSVILFTSDNGAPTQGEHENHGSNFPLRGQKESPWEGGIRAAAAIWSPLIATRHISSDNLLYVGDWLPTFLHLATGGGGVESSSSPQIDGVNQWNSISNPTTKTGSSSSRQEILHNIDPVIGYVAYLRNGFKYINGTTLENRNGGWYGAQDASEVPDAVAGQYVHNVKSSITWQALAKYAQKELSDADVVALRKAATVSCNSQPNTECDPLVSPCLFDIFEDPCEINNLAGVKVDQVLEMQAAVERWSRLAKPINNRPSDANADPRLHDYTWTWWLDEDTNAGRSLRPAWIVESVCLLIFLIALRIKN